MSFIFKSQVGFLRITIFTLYSSSRLLSEAGRKLTTIFPSVLLTCYWSVCLYVFVCVWIFASSPYATNCKHRLKLNNFTKCVSFSNMKHFYGLYFWKLVLNSNKTSICSTHVQNMYSLLTLFVNPWELDST